MIVPFLSYFIFSVSLIFCSLLHFYVIMHLAHICTFTSWLCTLHNFALSRVVYAPCTHLHFHELIMHLARTIQLKSTARTFFLLYFYSLFHTYAINCTSYNCYALKLAFLQLLQMFLHPAPAYTRIFYKCLRFYFCTLDHDWRSKRCRTILLFIAILPRYIVIV